MSGEGVVAISVAVLGVAFLLWLMRGGRSPEITAQTSPQQMGGRSFMAVILGICLLVAVFGVLGAAIGYPIDGPPDLEQQAHARDVVDRVLGEADHRDVEILALAPFVLVFFALLGWAVASLVI